MPFLDKQENREYQRLWRKLYENYPTALYNGMKKRLKHNPSYKNRKILFTKEEFIAWVFANPNYKPLHDNWVNSNYDCSLSPSVDRIDNKGDYSFDNIQLITHRENSSKMHKIDGVGYIHPLPQPGKKLYCEETNVVYDSIRQVELALNISRKKIVRILNKGQNTVDGFTLRYV